MSARRVAALDMAGRTGWAVWESSMAKPESGSKLVSEAAGAANDGQFFSAFFTWVEFKFCDADFIVYEQPYVNARTNQRTAVRLFGMAGLLEFLCERRAIECRKINIGDARRHFIGAKAAAGKREAVKKATIDQCEARGWPVVDDNEADALALMDYALPRIVDPAAIKWRPGYIPPLMAG